MTTATKWMVAAIVVVVLGLGYMASNAQRTGNNANTKAEQAAAAILLENHDRLVDDCEGRVEGRQVLRDIITQAFQPQTATPSPGLLAVYAARRDALLARAPELKCVTRHGLPIATPITEP